MAIRGRWRFGDGVPFLAVRNAAPVLTFSFSLVICMRMRTYTSPSCILLVRSFSWVCVRLVCCCPAPLYLVVFSLSCVGFESVILAG